MKLTRIFACFLALVFTFCLLPAGILQISADSTQSAETTNRHAQKIVSVVYDNSGSMESSDKRQHYAHYAMQMLTALLNPQDELHITPMNDKNGKNIETLDMLRSNIKDVDLAAADRGAQIQNLFSSNWHTPFGSTPLESVSSMLEYMQKDKGLGKSANEDKEYWLIVFTDGAFDYSSSSIANELKTPLKNFTNFHVIYLTLGSQVTEITDRDITASPNFTSYHSKDSVSLVAAMQKIANQLTGRCNTDKYTLDASGKKLTISMEQVGFSLRKISLLLQNSNATLKSASLNGTALSVTQPVTIKPNNALGMKNGYSAVIAEATGKTITGGTLTLEFTEAVSAKDLVIMLEPSLILKPVVEYEDKNGSRQVLSDPYSIGTLPAGTNVRIYYSIVDAETGKAVPDELVFGNDKVRTTLSHDQQNIPTASYDKRGEISVNPFRLTVGNHTAVLNVTSESTGNTSADSSYTLYTSFNYAIADNPNYFRVESKSERVSPDNYQYEITFTVFSENLPLTKAQLANYDWTCYTDDGLTFKPAVKEENGIAVIRGIADPKDFGEYKITLRVTDKNDRSRVAETTTSVTSYPGDLSIDVSGPSEAQMTENEFRNSKETFSFVLEMDGKKKDFDSADIVYTATLNGSVDITNACKAENGKLVIALSHGNLGRYILTPGTSEITVTAKVPAAALEDSVSVRFVLDPSQYLVLPFVKGGEEIDRFKLHKNTVAAYFEVQRDDISLSAEELQAFLDAGIVTMDAELAKSKTSVAKLNFSVETVNGKAMICVTPTNNHPRVLYDWITSMLIFGQEKDFTASVYGAQATATVPMQTPNPWSYIWRIGLFFVLAYLIWWILSWIFKTKYLPKGIFCYAQVKIDDVTDNSQAISLTCTKINESLMDKFMLRRLFPGAVTQSRSVTAAGVNLTLLPNGKSSISVTLSKVNFPNAKIWKMGSIGPLNAKATAIANTFFGGVCAKDIISSLDFSHTEKEITFNSKTDCASLVVNSLTNPICLKPANDPNGTYHLIFFVKAP